MNFALMLCVLATRIAIIGALTIPAAIYYWLLTTKAAF